MRGLFIEIVGVLCLATGITLTFGIGAGLICVGGYITLVGFADSGRNDDS